MDNIISKELFSEVLGHPIFTIGKIKGNKLTYCIEKKNGKKSSGFSSINIHALAHKCKEWAFKEGYNLWCYPKKIEISKNGIKVDTVHNVNFDNPISFDPIMDIEACQVVFSSIKQDFKLIDKDNLKSYINKTIYHGSNKDECIVTRIIRKDELMVKMVSEEFASSHSNVFIKDCWVKE